MWFVLIPENAHNLIKTLLPWADAINQIYLKIHNLRAKILT